MRAPLLGPLAASSFFNLAAAQISEYGQPESQSSLGSEESVSHAAPEPSPSCHQEIATTVFVTVLPTSPMGPSDGSQPDDASAVHTVTETVPATTVFISAGAPDTSGAPDDSSPSTFTSDGPPAASDVSAQSSLISSATWDPSSTGTEVKPFTTLTIDIWDNVSGEDGDSASKSAPAGESSAASDSSHPSNNPPADNTGNTDTSGGGKSSDSKSWTTDAGDGNGSVPTAYDTTQDTQLPTDGASAATTQDGIEMTDEVTTWYTVVTDSDVYWTTGPSGPSQATILLSHTLTVEGPAPTATVVPDTQSTATDIPGPEQNASDIPSSDQIDPQSNTVVGPDGNPTIIVGPSTLPDSDDDQVYQQFPACTKTITGADGRATIIIEPIDDSSSNDGAISSGLPTITVTHLPDSSSSPAYPGVPNQSTQSDGSSLGGLYTTFTSFGGDGLPTVIESALPFPRPAPVTQSGPQPTQPPPVGQPGLPGTGWASTVLPYDPQDGLGVTTSFTFTFFGANGPTAVESTVVIFPTPGAPGSSASVPSIFTNTGGVADGVTEPAPAVTTCFSYTVMGTDGLPTVVDSTVVLSPTPGNANSDLNPPIPAVPGSSQGLPESGGAPIVTAFSHTFIGPDGYPTVLATTLVVPPTGGLSAPTPTFGPSGGLPSGFPPVSGTNDGLTPAVTTCTTFTYIGPDGNPTITEYTYTTAGPVTAATALPGVITPPFGTPGSPIPGVPGSPNDAAAITSSSLTYIGSDGKPTVTVYTWTTSGPLTVVTDIPGNASPPIGFPTPPTLGAPAFPSNTAVTSCTTFTYTGADGKPTITEYTWSAVPPFTAATALPGNNAPGVSVPVLPTPGVPANSKDGGVTTCATFTVLGADGQPTVTEASWIVAGPIATQSPLPFPQIPTDLPNGLSSEFPSQITGLPGLPSNPSVGNGLTDTTIWSSYTILGTDGRPTVLGTVWTVPLGIPTPTQTSIGFPSVVPAPTNLPQGIPAGNPVTTSYTAFSVGPDGLFTPVVQTIVYTQGPLSATAGVPLPVPSGLVDGGSPSDAPSLSQYGQGSANVGNGIPVSVFPPGFTPIITDGRQLPVSGVLPPFITGTVTATSTSTTTETSLPGPGFPGAPEGLPPTYGGVGNDGSENSGLGGLAQPYNPGSVNVPSELTLWPSSVVYGATDGDFPAASTPCSDVVLQTSTWVNVIPEQTTTYTLNYPLTTLITLPTLTPVPSAKRAVHRQEVEPHHSWSNTTTPELLPSVLAPSPTLSPLDPATPSSQPTLCSNGGNVGNYTLNFDNLPSGPLYNPDGDFWFSEGFSVIPPTAQTGSYSPSSGGQLLEFTPLSLLSSSGGTGDTAEIGVGPHVAISCFKFDLYGLSLGCAATGNEQWCEFEFSAYAYDENTGGAHSKPWSETKRVPACPTYPAGPCTLTPIELIGYTNITSVLITLRVGLDLRVWWGDDLRVGWTDNSCEAGTCRGDVSTASAQRAQFDLSLRKRFSRMVSTGLKTMRGHDG